MVTTFRVSTAIVDNLNHSDYVHALRASKHVDDVSLHKHTYMYIHTYIHTHIHHKYSDFLVVLISVGLTQARPNY